jgi:hypothetical protein
VSRRSDRGLRARLTKIRQGQKQNAQQFGEATEVGLFGTLYAGGEIRRHELLHQFPAEYGVQSSHKNGQGQDGQLPLLKRAVFQSLIQACTLDRASDCAMAPMKLPKFSL